MQKKFVIPYWIKSKNGTNLINVMEKNFAIFDLDGTIANIKKRKKISTKRSGKIDWEKFFDPNHIKLDIPNKKVIKISNLLYQDGYKILIFSGRSKVTYNETIKWLNKYKVKYHKIEMREDKDFRPDEIIKKEFLYKHTKPENVFIVFDDRNKVVEMWRSLNITCFQVDNGDF